MRHFCVADVVLCGRHQLRSGRHGLETSVIPQKADDVLRCWFRDDVLVTDGGGVQIVFGGLFWWWRCFSAVLFSHTGVFWWLGFGGVLVVVAVLLWFFC